MTLTTMQEVELADAQDRQQTRPSARQREREARRRLDQAHIGVAYAYLGRGLSNQSTENHPLIEQCKAGYQKALRAYTKAVRTAAKGE